MFFEKVSLVLVSNESCLMIEMIPVPNMIESGIISDSSEFLPGFFVLKYLGTIQDVKSHFISIRCIADKSFPSVD